MQVQKRDSDQQPVIVELQEENGDANHIYSDEEADIEHVSKTCFSCNNLHFSYIVLTIKYLINIILY